jgi:hypothetical protein
MGNVFLVWAAPDELVGVYANREVADMEAEIERAKCRESGVPGAADLVRVSEVMPRTRPVRRTPENPPVPWISLSDEGRQLAQALGGTQAVVDAEFAEWSAAEGGRHTVAGATDAVSTGEVHERIVRAAKARVLQLPMLSLDEVVVLDVGGQLLVPLFQL